MAGISTAAGLRGRNEVQAVCDEPKRTTAAAATRWALKVLAVALPFWHLLPIFFSETSKPNLGRRSELFAFKGKSLSAT